MRRFRSFLILAIAIIAIAQTTRPQASPDHTVWVADVLKRMQSIQPGMTRATLLTVFTTEGGLSTRLHRTYVSRDCRYFKVDVEFQAANAQATDGEAVILKISRPYLQFTIAD
jgi:hypothetical protein